MLETITLEEAQSSLPELIDRLKHGAEIVIMRNNQPVAELHLPSGVLPQPRFGNCRGSLTILAEDDEHLQSSRVTPRYSPICLFITAILSTA